MNRDEIVNTPISRRRVLAGGALAGVAVFLAACGTKGAVSGTPSAADTPAPTPAPTGSAPASSGPSASAAAATPGVPEATPSAEMNWAQWSYYIDVDPNDPSKHPTIDAFTKKYGTVVHYKEVIEANDSFFAKIQPALSAGKDTGWDLVTLTDWMAARLIRLNWIEAFNTANVPNLIANIKDVYKTVDWDPNVVHHAPWRSGTTGLGFDSAVTGDLTSLAALYTADPRWTGKVEYLSEMRDAVGLTMLYLGLDPATPTRANCDQAIAVMQKAKSDGIIRDVKGQSYTTDLVSGDAVLTMAWSGDMVQAQVDGKTKGKTLQYALATEGGLLWTDNLMIPKGAAHLGTAELLVNYYYDPAVSALVSAAVSYVSPVKGSDEIVAQTNPTLANSPLINPPADWVARLHIFGGLSSADETYFNQQFAKVIGVG